MPREILSTKANMQCRSPGATAPCWVLQSVTRLHRVSPPVTSAPAIRVLRPGDEPALEAFLGPLTDTSMFLRANARSGGLEDQGQVGQGTYLAAFEGDAIAGVIAQFWHGVVGLQAPRHLAALIQALPGHAPRPVTGLSGPWAQVAEARALLGLQQAPTKLKERETLLALPPP